MASTSQSAVEYIKKPEPEPRTRTRLVGGLLNLYLIVVNLFRTLMLHLWIRCVSFKDKEINYTTGPSGSSEEAQLEKLAVEDSKVTTVGKLRFVKDNDEYRIATGSDGTEVFLGLRDDGTEVAVKRMPQLYFKELKRGTDFQPLLGLNDPSIVPYVDLDEDENFGYLALLLCEYTLEEYIVKSRLPEQGRKNLAEQVLNSLKILHGQNPPILHGDIKPQNVLIDIHNKARLANFGISRLTKGKTTHHLSSPGATCWTAKETLYYDGKKSKRQKAKEITDKRSTDIQVAGMLTYYILSGGQHPFGKGFRCAGNICNEKYNLDHVDDVDAKDLIKKMINGDPEKRPTVETCLAHNFFHPVKSPILKPADFEDLTIGSKEKKNKRNQVELRDDPIASTSTTTPQKWLPVSKRWRPQLEKLLIMNASTSTIPHNPDASTSTTPRKWLPVSKRWRPQLEKLVNMDDSKVKSLVFGKGKEFLIGEGSNGVEVFLGLRDDGSEIAVKRMSKTCDLYNDLKNDELYLGLPELDDPSIVRYVDFVEDEDYGYLATQLCEYTLDEYITELPEQGRKRLAKQVLNSLRILHCQDSQILHRDIKPQNVLIDIQGKARLADFGVSRQIDQGKTTYHTKVAGTPCWMAKETLNKSDAYKRSTDIQVAGMLIHYILSGGHHPFLEDTTNGTIFECQYNISKGNYCLKHIDDDMVAKDLVEWMIHGEPEKRPKVEQCLAHPFFWPNTRREEYLSKIGNEKEVEKHRKAEQDENKAKDEEEKKLIRSLKVLIPALEQYAEQGQFNTWKQKFREAEEETRKLFEGLDEYKTKKGPDGKRLTIYSDNSFGLLRFIRNLHAHNPEILVHSPDAVAGINLMKMFPALFGYVYKFAKEQDGKCLTLLLPAQVSQMCQWWHQRSCMRSIVQTWPLPLLHRQCTKTKYRQPMNTGSSSPGQGCSSAV